MAINPQEIKVALLCGGKSGEREISLASGRELRLLLNLRVSPFRCSILLAGRIW